MTDVVARLAAAGCVAPEDEARELLRDAPDAAELRLIRDVLDPKGLRKAELKS